MSVHTPSYRQGEYRLRILIITHFYPPGHIGGTEVLTVGLAKSLVAKGHTVEVLCGESWETAASYEIQVTQDVHEGVPVRRLHFNWTKAPNVFAYLYNNPQVKNYLSGYLQEFQPDLVHITSCNSLSASVVDVVKGAHIPILLTATDFWFICARNTLLRHDNSLCTGRETPWKCARCMLGDAKIYQWPRQILPEAIVAPMLLNLGRIPMMTRQRGTRAMLGNWQERFDYLDDALAKVDRIVTASDFLRRLFIEHGVDANKISFSRYGLDTSWAEQYTYKTPTEKLRIGFIGQILPFKGPDLLLKAIAKLDRDAPIEVMIYGGLDKTPTYGAELRALAGDDPRIHFAGTFPITEIGRVLHGMDVFVVPSTWYDFPLVISSALATKTPVLTTNLPGMNEMIKDGVNGLLFERSDVDGIATALRRLLDEPGLLTRLQAGIQQIKTVDEMTDEYIAVYQQLHKQTVERDNF